jgi:WD40 repeat protein
MIEMQKPDQESRRIETRGPYCVNESPDGHLIVSGLYYGGPKLWSASTFSEILLLDDSFSIVRTAIISNDNKYLVSANEDDSKVTVWNLESILGYEVVYEGKGLLAQRNTNEKTVLVKNSGTDTLIDNGASRSQITLSGTSQSATISRDAKYLARATETAIEIWNLPEQQQRCSFQLPKYPVFELAFSPDANHLLAHSVKGDWICFDLTRSQVSAQQTTMNIELPIYAISEDSLNMVVFRHPRESMQDDRFAIRTVNEDKVIESINGRAVESLVFDRSGDVLYMAQDFGITVHDIRSNISDTSRFRPRQRIERIAISPDNLSLAAYVKNEGIFLWDTATGEELFCILSTTEVIDQLEWSADSILQCRATNGDVQRFLRFQVSPSK